VSDTDQVCLVERDDKVLIVTMNRPHQRNALNAALRQALRDAFDLLDDDPGLRCAVLSGAGPSFCAGGDLKEMAGAAVTVPPEEWGCLLGSRGFVRKPVIAAVHGHAFAGGFRLVQGADLCIATPTASFGISEVKRGRGAPWAAPLITMLPRKVMAELLITGEPMTGERAYAVGLVNALVSAEALLPSSVELAHLIAANAPLSVLAAKQLVDVASEVGQTQALRHADAIYEAVYRSEDALEGPRAFAERRPPEWQGR
jgi:enoyl-CoA hydratase/carnithine racemase